MSAKRLIVILLWLLLAACTAAPATSTPSPAPPPAAQIDEAQVIAAAIRQVYTVDHTFGGHSPNFPHIYLLAAAVEVGPGLQRGELPSDPLAAAVIAALADLPAQFVWVQSADEAPRDAHGTVIDGAVISVGPIQPQPDGTVHVSASIYFAMLGAGGQTYVLEQQAGVWVITGTTGTFWIS